MSSLESLDDFAGLILDLLRSDRDVSCATGGMTGEGKSAFDWALAKAYSKKSRMPVSMDSHTWSRRELLTWIDGEGKARKGQKPEFSVLIPDELIFMFYRRRWFDDEQIEGIETFNTCRDRHLFVIGGVPSFWSLDPAFTSRVRYYIYVPERGLAWVFQQENNPFVKDPWNPLQNLKGFRRMGNPRGLPNFVCELRFPDFSPAEKVAYYGVRNLKRVTAKDESHQGHERYKEIKGQRDKVCRLAFKYCGKRRGRGQGMSVQEFADYVGLSREMCKLILEGVEAPIIKEPLDSA